MLRLQRGPIQGSSSQPCCKHYYFTPPSLSLTCFEKGTIYRSYNIDVLSQERTEDLEGRCEAKLDWDRGSEDWKNDRIRKKTARAAHRLYTVKQKKKGALQLLPKYAYRIGMQHGALSKRNKDSTVSGSLSPVLPHPHIISWKIPEICCNFFSLFFFLLLFLLLLLVQTKLQYPGDPACRCNAHIPVHSLHLERCQVISTS